MSFFKSFFEAENERVQKRDRLFDAIARGEMLPEQGEAVARDQGVGPLCPLPNAEEFDVSKQDVWTIPMVLAWIIWRSTQRIRDFFDPFRLACPYWQYAECNLPADDGVGVEKRAGHLLKHREPATMSDVNAHAWLLEPDSELGVESQNFGAARVELGTHLLAGSLKAIGFRPTDAQAAIIPHYEWAYLRGVEDRGRDVLVLEPDPTRTARYSHVLFRRVDVLRIWKPSKRSSRDRREAEQLFLNVLCEWMGASPSYPTKTKREVIAYANKAYGLSADAAKSIWKEAVARTGAIAWAKPGRRRKIDPK